MPKVRCVRIIEYIGEIDWLKDQLERSYLYPGETKSFDVSGTFREVNRFIEEYKPETTNQSVVDDEEIPF